MTAAVSIFAWSFSYSASGQIRNEVVLSGMIAQCVSPEVVTGSPVVISLPERVAFAEPDVVGAFLNAGRVVIDADSTQDRSPNGSSEVVLAIDDASVTYRRHGRRRLTRTVALRARFVVRSELGELRRADRCEDSATDEILRSDVQSVENAAYPVTQGEVPGPGGLRRIAVPVVATAAAVVSAYLLFSLRSESGADS